MFIVPKCFLIYWLFDFTFTTLETMLSSGIPPSNVTFHELGFSFPPNATLHAINEHRTCIAYLIEDESMILMTAFHLHIIRLNLEPKHKVASKLPARPNAIKFITINNSSKSTASKQSKLQHSIVLGYDSGFVQVMDTNGSVLFSQHISHSPIKSISLHFDNCFYAYCPSLILNCQSRESAHLLFITADEVYRTCSNSLRYILRFLFFCRVPESVLFRLFQIHRPSLDWDNSNDMDSAISTLWSPKKIILTQCPVEIVDIISVPPIDLMKHGIKLSLLDPVLIAIP